MLRYDKKKKRNEVIIDGINFENGVVLYKEEEFVLVEEKEKSRIKRYYLKGKKKGNRDILIDGMKGIKDNLKYDGKGGLMVVLIV